ncbi:Uncharacterised protein [Salmonella enterica subsp. enterica serovar Typhimurium]|nr:Uncharacterised protein [Salmonella enterica subsp. enterica serovar Typhimurium]
MKDGWRVADMRWRNRKRTGAFNPLTLEKVCRLKMPLMKSNWPWI